MRILFINNEGAGLAEYLDVVAGTTLESLFHRRLPDRKIEDYHLRINRQPAPHDYVLQDNDRVTVTPAGMQACC